MLSPEANVHDKLVSPPFADNDKDISRCYAEAVLRMCVSPHLH